MKVLFLDQFSDLGGAQHCLLDLLPEVEARGWKSVVAAPAGALLDCAQQWNAVTEVLNLPKLTSTTKSSGDWVRFLRQVPALACGLQSVLEMHRPDVIYANGPRVVPALAWAKPRVPVVFHSHHFIAQAMARRLTQRGLNQLKARVIACCRYTGGQWRGTEPIVIYNGVAPLKYRERQRGEVVRVGVLGRVAPEKGHTVFLEAAARLSNKKSTVHFVVIGAPLFGDVSAERYYAQVREGTPSQGNGAAQAGLPIEFTGWLEDPSAALSGLDLLVVPSTGPEATTRVVPEAWAAGVPVLASNIGGIAEIMKDGWNGFLFEPGSAAELAEGIERILALTTAEIGTITRNARRQYEERFTRARYAREVCDSIVRIVGGHAPNQ